MHRETGWALSFLGCIVAGTSAQQVPFEKYRLSNGMTVILHEDHALPVACVNIWYRVGSKDEPDRRSGFAHLFEHLMFMGTRRVPGGDFDQIMESGGGFNNASTSEDRTNYYSFGPASLLPTLLWLDADRLEDLAKEMTQEKLDRQRDVVRNERRQSYENRPYGKSELRVLEEMYPPGHPYRRSVIGSHEDLEAATVPDVNQFFSTYYVPSNASLVVAGDFDAGRIKPLIQELFGTLPRGSDAPRPVSSLVAPSRIRRVTMTDDVQFARSTMVFHSPSAFAPGDAEMDLNAEILAAGVSSRLYQKLIYQGQLAVSVEAYQSSMQLGSLFYIQATAKPGVELDRLEAAMDEVLVEFRNQGPNSDELERCKTRHERRMVAQMETLLNRADKLNEYEYFRGEPDSFQWDLDRYRQVTATAAREAARSVLNLEDRLVLRVVPEVESAGEDPRDRRPEQNQATPLVIPTPAEFRLSNGIPVFVWSRPRVPLVAVRLELRGGAALDAADKAGTARLTADMLDEGAGSRGAVEFADALDLLGTSLRVGVDHEWTTVSLEGLARNQDGALELLADAVLRPRFEESEWNRVHRLHVENLLADLDEPAVLATWTASREFFGAEHPYGLPVEGTPASARRIGLSEVRRHYDQVFQPGGATFLVAGDVSPEVVRSSLERLFGPWQAASNASKPSGPMTYPTRIKSGRRVVIVDRPGSVQTVVRFLWPGPVYGDPRRVSYELLNTILGGSFTSRLNQNLREVHGFTYGARSRFLMDPAIGYFVAGADVRADATGDSVREFLKEFDAIRSGSISAEETAKARATRNREIVDDFERLSGMLGAAGELIQNALPLNELGADLGRTQSITAVRLNGLSREILPPGDVLLVLVGDRHQIEPQLAGCNLPAPEVITDARARFE